MTTVYTNTDELHQDFLVFKRTVTRMNTNRLYKWAAKYLNVSVDYLQYFNFETRLDADDARENLKQLIWRKWYKMTNHEELTKPTYEETVARKAYFFNTLDSLINRHDNVLERDRLTLAYTGYGKGRPVKLTYEDFIHIIKLFKAGVSVNEMKDFLSYSYQMIYSILKGKSCKGYYSRYGVTPPLAA